ncbi:MAG: flavin reductase family protein [Bacteroidales bacterium]|jgi:flavin reductase (DIM6/NTAB) family NADH-FMN oxidoreductase RutF|nr:flavin reductase family protein [Bacteroidales bacterium]
MDINTFSKLTYGVYIVASGDKDTKNAFIATVVFQVTAIPEKIAIVCNKDNHTLKFIQEKKAFSISVLRQNYSPLTLGAFGFRSGKDFDKFKNCNYIIGENTGVPIVLDDTISWFECDTEQELDLGTHILFVGKTLDCKIISEDDIPLTYQYYHEIKKGMTPKNAPSYIEINKISNQNK